MALKDTPWVSQKQGGIAPVLVSVVIPSYNLGRYLGEAIDSALGQTYPHVEVVVVDDSSSDNSLEIARAYGDRIRVVVQPNAGVSAARNAGVRASHGAIVMFLDADDTLDPDCIQSRISGFDDESVGIVAGAYRLVDEALQVLPKRGGFRGPRSARASTYVREAWSPTCGLMVRRRAMEVCGLFDPLLRAAEDWDLQMRVTRRFKHVYDVAPRANYRQVPGSLSRDLVPMVDSIVQVLRKNRAYAPSDYRYLWDGAFGLSTQIFGSVFGRLLAEHRGTARVRAFATILRARPWLALLLLVWGARFVGNRMLRLVGLGPLARRARDVRDNG